MPVHRGLVNTRDGQKRLPRQFLPMCTFSVGIVAMALIQRREVAALIRACRDRLGAMRGL